MHKRNVNNMVFSSLLTFGPSDTLDLFGVCADVIDNGALEIREFQVPTFLYDIGFHSLNLVEEEGTMTRLNVEDG